MHCELVFLGRPRFPGQGIFILVIVLMQVEKRITCPYHLSRLMKRASFTSCIPSLAQSNVVGVSSPGLVLQIQRTIVLSFLQSLCRSSAVGAMFRFHVAMQSTRMHRKLYPSISWHSICFFFRLIQFSQFFSDFQLFRPEYQRLK